MEYVVLIVMPLIMVGMLFASIARATRLEKRRFAEHMAVLREYAGVSCLSETPTGPSPIYDNEERGPFRGAAIFGSGAEGAFAVHMPRPLLGGGQVTRSLVLLSRAGPPQYISVVPKGWLGRLGATPKMAEQQSGDSDFDARFEVWADDPGVAAALRECGACASLIALPRDVRFMTFDGKRVDLRWEGYERDCEVIDIGLRAAREAARAFASMSQAAVTRALAGAIDRPTCDQLRRARVAERWPGTEPIREPRWEEIARRCH